MIEENFDKFQVIWPEKSLKLLPKILPQTRQILIAAAEYTANVYRWTTFINYNINSFFCCCMYLNIKKSSFIFWPLVKGYPLVAAIFLPTLVSRDRESRPFFWREFLRTRDRDIFFLCYFLFQSINIITNCCQAGLEAVPSSHARGQRFKPRHPQYFKLLLDPGDFSLQPQRIAVLQ